MKDDLLVQRQIRRPRRLRARRPPTLHIAQILAWADAWFERTGRWPMARSGHIPETAGETWNSVNQALSQGFRGLPGGSSLRRLLARHRGVRNKCMLPRLSIEQILEWADAWFERTGRWPEAESGYIPGTTGEKWMHVEIALRQGSRGLPGGSSLARLLAEQRGKRNRRALPPYSMRQILAWADAHHARTGRWPNSHSGPIREAPGETWQAVDMALSQGLRGLPGGSSLPRLLARRRGVRNHLMVPPLSIEQILAWADAHFARTGRWPSKLSGPIPGTRGETWSGVDGALRLGQRGLPGGSSLPRLLAERRRVPNRHAMPFSVEQILAWADAHFKRTGRRPNTRSGTVAERPGVTWLMVDGWLRTGRHGLPGGSSLRRLLQAHGRVRL
ncbi:MAG: hypothetical protein WD847_09015 [Pirellulales bacterium]